MIIQQSWKCRVEKSIIKMHGKKFKNKSHCHCPTHTSLVIIQPNRIHLWLSCCIITDILLMTLCYCSAHSYKLYAFPVPYYETFYNYFRDYLKLPASLSYIKPFHLPGKHRLSHTTLHPFPCHHVSLCLPSRIQTSILAREHGSYHTAESCRHYPSRVSPL